MRGLIRGVIAAAGASAADPPITSPEDFGEDVLSWTRGDEATMAGGDSLVYSSLTDDGSFGVFGDNFGVGTDAHPVATTVGGRNVPQVRGLRRFVSELGASSWGLLKSGGSNYTRAISFYLYQVTDGAMLEGTFDGITSTQQGYAAIIDGDILRVRIASGSGMMAVNVASTVTLTPGRHTLVVSVSVDDGTISVAVDGETPVTAFTAGATATTSTNTLTLGNNFAGTAALDGIIEETVLLGAVLSPADVTRLTDYFAAEWSEAPVWSPLAWHEDLQIWTIFSRGVSLSGSSITASADQSGYNNDVSQATPSNQPAYDATAIDGNPASTADGANDFLRIAALTQGDVAQPSTQYVMARWDAWATGDFICGGTSARQDVFASGAQMSIFAGATLSVSIPGASVAGDLDGVPFVLRGVFEGASSKLRVQFDGFAEAATSGNAGTQSLSGSTLHATLNGTGTSSSTIGERLVFAGVAGSDTSADDVLDVALRAKYTVGPP